MKSKNYIENKLYYLFFNSDTIFLCFNNHINKILKIKLYAFIKRLLYDVNTTYFNISYLVIIYNLTLYNLIMICEIEIGRKSKPILIQATFFNWSSVAIYDRRSVIREILNLKAVL